MCGTESFKATEFARLEKEVRASAVPAAFERLASFLGGDQGELEYRLSGYVRKDEKPAISLSVRGTVTLVCQRCLGPLTVTVDAHRELVFVASGRLTSFDDEEDDADYLPLDEMVDAHSLVEEEVLLALPMSPRHAEDECPVGAPGDLRQGAGRPD